MSLNSRYYKEIAVFAIIVGIYLLIVHCMFVWVDACCCGCCAAGVSTTVMSYNIVVTNFILVYHPQTSPVLRNMLCSVDKS
jgi:hypothetical protein